MKRYTIAFFALALLLGSCAKDDMATPAPRPDNGVEAAAGELMVKFTPYVAEIIEEQVLTRGAATRSGVLSVDEILNLVDGYSIERVFPVDSRNEERTRDAGLHLWYRVCYGAETPAEEVAERMSQLGEVQKVSLNRTIHRAYNARKKAIPLAPEAMAALAQTRADEYPFNDELMSLQWDIINRGTLFPGVDGTENKAVAGADVQCEEAWKLSTGDPSIIVAVLDEGVFIEHPDLKASMWHNEDEVYRSHKDNDGNGYKGDYYGYNFVKNTGVITWDNVYDTGHASHVAGVIAAQNDNGGMGSIAGGTATRPGVRIMSCQIFSGNTQSDSYASIRAIKYAADNGAVVLQCSWGYTSGEANIYDWGLQGFKDEEEWAMLCPLEKEVIDYFTHQAGSPNGPIEGGIAVFASGNESAPMAGFPGAAEMCVSVSATAADFTPAVYTNYGPGTTIAAPGGDQDYYYEYVDEIRARGELGCILSALPYHVAESGYGYMEGTSMACPHVSGVVALALSHAAQLRLHYTAEEFKELLYANVTPIDDYCAGIKHFYRYVSDIGVNHAKQMDLGAYRGKMGAGQVNAALLLAAIGENGTPMLFPNLYVGVGETLNVNPALYFVGGESMEFSFSVEDGEVASIVKSDGRYVVEGLKAGMTKATITAGSTKQEFTITVRAHAGDNGWL